MIDRPDRPEDTQLALYIKSFSSTGLFTTRDSGKEAYDEMLDSITLIKNPSTRSNMMIGLHIMINSILAEVKKIEARDTKAREDREKVRRSIHGA